MQKQNINNAVDEAINKLGPDILLNDELFLNIIEDLVPYLTDDLKTMKFIFNSDLGSKLRDAYISTNERNQYCYEIQQYLQDDIGLSRKKILQFIGYFSFLSEYVVLDTRSDDIGSNGLVSNSKRVLLRVLNRTQGSNYDKRDRYFNIGEVVQANIISNSLPQEPLFQLLLNDKNKQIGIKNLSDFEWTIVKPDRTIKSCRPQQIVAIQKDYRVRILYMNIQLNVLEIGDIT